MTVSNFKLIEVIGSSPATWKYLATVDCTTKKWFFGKTTTRTRDIFKCYAGSWHFIDNGEFTEGLEVEKLVRIFEAEKRKELEFCLET